MRQVTATTRVGASGSSISTGFNSVNRSHSLGKIGPIELDAPRSERSLDQLNAPDIDQELSAALFETVSETMADPALLRPAGMCAVLEALQRDLTQMNASTPEDLFELALGVLEDELKNAENLQDVLQRMTNR